MQFVFSKGPFHLPGAVLFKLQSLVFSFCLPNFSVLNISLFEAPLQHSRKLPFKGRIIYALWAHAGFSLYFVCDRNIYFESENLILLFSHVLFQINASSADDGLNFYDSGHRFEHSQLLLVLLRSLPYASRSFQSRALQVLFPCFLCSAIWIHLMWIC